MNTAGAVIAHVNASAGQAGINTMQMNTSHVARGMYLVKLRWQNKVITRIAHFL
jgi:hypothetical protein